MRKCSSYSFLNEHRTERNEGEMKVLLSWSQMETLLMNGDQKAKPNAYPFRYTLLLCTRIYAHLHSALKALYSINGGGGCS